MKALILLLACTILASACTSLDLTPIVDQSSPGATAPEFPTSIAQAAPIPTMDMPSETIVADSSTVLSTLPASPKPPDPNMLWSADFEDGTLSQWYSDFGGGVFNLGSGRVVVTDKMAHSGRFSAAMTIDDGAGVPQAVRLFRWKENPAEAYYGVWFLFPQRYKPALWWNVLQFKTNAPYPLDTIWVINVGNRPDGNLFFYLYDWQNGKTYEQTIRDVPIGQWVHVQVFYRRSTEKQGRITLWQDGVQLFDLDGVRTATSNYVHWSVDNYTDGISPSPVTIYADDVTVSKERVEK